MTAKLIFFAGSARKESLNKKLAQAAANTASDIGAEVTVIDLADYELPIYNGDFEDENGMPQAAIDLKELFSSHDGFLIASPEYNSSYSALLKNTIDWMTRPHMGDEPFLMAFNGKVAALTAASPGGLGGLRGLAPLRVLLSNIGVHVIPTQMALSGAGKAFDADGNLSDDKQKSMLTKVVKQLTDTAEKLRS